MRPSRSAEAVIHGRALYDKDLLTITRAIVYMHFSSCISDNMRQSVALRCVALHALTSSIVVLNQLESDTRDQSFQNCFFSVFQRGLYLHLRTTVHRKIRIYH